MSINNDIKQQEYQLWSKGVINEGVKFIQACRSEKNEPFPGLLLMLAKSRQEIAKKHQTPGSFGVFRTGESTGLGSYMTLLESDVYPKSILKTMKSLFVKNDSVLK